MENNLKQRDERRFRRSLRVRKKVRGTAEKPRLSVCKTNAHLYAQLIDDDKGVTLASTSTLSKELKGTEHNSKSMAAAEKLGEIIAKQAKSLNITHVVFDRGFRQYHGVIARLADKAREHGLQF